MKVQNMTLWKAVAGGRDYFIPLPYDVMYAKDALPLLQQTIEAKFSGLSGIPTIRDVSRISDFCLIEVSTEVSK